MIDLEREDLRTIMRQPAGRRFMWALLDACGYADTTGHRDPAVMAELSHKRDVAVEIVARLQAQVPSEYALMVREVADAILEAENRERIKEAQKAGGG